MSTRREIYLMAAVVLNSGDAFAANEESDGDFFHSFRVPYRGCCAVGNMGILMDGMSENYVLVGKVLAVSDDEGEQSFGMISVEPVSQELMCDVLDFISSNDLGNLVKDWTVKNYLVDYWH